MMKAKFLCTSSLIPQNFAVRLYPSVFFPSLNAFSLLRCFCGALTSHYGEEVTGRTLSGSHPARSNL